MFEPICEYMIEKKGHREWVGWLPPVIASPPQAGEAILPMLNKDCFGPSGLAMTPKYRFRFSKTGDARFMGHLELMDVLKRSLGRLKVPVAFSQGFHPQMKISMGYPLPTGIESEWEFFDLELKEGVNPQS